MLSREDEKQTVKEALKEWLDAKFSIFGKWAFGSLVSIVLAAALYLFFMTQGWKAPL